MSRINFLNLSLETERCKAAIGELTSDQNAGVSGTVLREYLACIVDALAEIRRTPPGGPLNLEKRLDAAGRYIRDLHVNMVPDCRAIQSEPHAGWVAALATDRIGNAEQTFVRYGTSPADAIDAALKDAAEWVQRQRDIR